MPRDFVRTRITRPTRPQYSRALLYDQLTGVESHNVRPSMLISLICSILDIKYTFTSTVTGAWFVVGVVYSGRGFG